MLAVGDGRFGSWAGWDFGSRLPLLLACAWSRWQHWEPSEKSMQQEIFEMPRQDIDSNKSLEATAAALGSGTVTGVPTSSTLVPALPSGCASADRYGGAGVGV